MMLEGSWLKQATNSKRLYWAGLSIILSVGVVYLVWSGRYLALIEFKGLFIIAGIFLILASLFFCTKANIGRGVSPKARMMFLFGPGISSGLAGLAMVFAGLIPRFISDEFLWIAGLLALFSFASFQIAFIFALLSARHLRKNSGKPGNGT